MKYALICSVFCLSVLVCPAQTNPAQANANSKGSALDVEQSVPFGTVSGQLIVLPQYLVFTDQQQIESSYVIPRSNVESVNAQGPTITVQTRDSIHDRSGDVRRLNFRVLRGDPAVLNTWYVNSADRVGANASPSASTATSFEATHDHTFGSCHGRLLVSDTQLSYESIDNLDHSRRWDYASIRELSQSNPYEIEIKPATGSDYKLKLGGSGMDPAQFKQLVERVTAARAGVNP